MRENRDRVEKNAEPIMCGSTTEKGAASVARTIL